MIQFEQIRLKLGNRLRLNQNRRTVQRQIRRRAGLGFDQVSGKDRRGITRLLAVNPNSALRMQNSPASLRLPAGPSPFWSVPLCPSTAWGTITNIAQHRKPRKIETRIV